MNHWTLEDVKVTMNLSRTICFSAAVASSMLGLSTAPALGANAVIVQPVGASTTSPQFTPILQSIDQSGLSSGYTSGVTEFDTYEAATGHDNNNATQWKTGVAFPITATLDLGSALDINGLGLWGAFGTSNPDAFDVYSDTDDDFGNGGTTLLGSYNGSAAEGGSVAALFAGTTTQFLHVVINSNHGNVDTNIGEFAVRQYFPDTDGDGVPDIDDNCPNDPNVENVTQATIHATIADALASANPGDELVLGPCVFHETGLEAFDNNLLIRGQGPGLTIIDGDYAGRIYEHTGETGVVIKGVTFTEGLATSANGGGAISMFGGQLDVIDCHFVANDGNGHAFSAIDNSGGAAPRYSSSIVCFTTTSAVRPPRSAPVAPSR